MKKTKSNTNNNSQVTLRELALKPMPLWQQLVIFGTPGVLIFIGTWFLMPILIDSGVHQALAFALGVWVPIFILLPLPFVMYRMEGGEMIWTSFRDRFRLQRPGAKDYLWGFLGLLIALASEEIFMKGIVAYMAQIDFISPPAHFPILFDPTREMELPITEFLGITLSGNWLFLAVLVPVHTFMMAIEELLWRGYILPRQELNYGKWAWLLNGLFWAYLVHMLIPWAFIGFLPSMLIAPYLAQRCKNTWVSMMVHGIGNSFLWVIFLYSVLS